MRRRKRYIRLFLLCVLVLAVMVFSVVFYYLQTRHQQVEEPIERIYCTQNLELERVGDLEIHHAYIADGSPRRPGEIREIRYITIHETDNRGSSSTAKAHDEFLRNNFQDITGWHYTVDDTEIYHHIPDNEIAWNAGDGRTRNGGNINGIGIEMCVSLGIDYDQTMYNTAMLTAALLYNYDLTLEDVKLHEDFMDKVCPHRMITEGRVDEFKEMVYQEYNKLVQQNESEQEDA